VSLSATVLLIHTTPQRGFVRDLLLRRYWSPQEVAAKLREMHTDEPVERVSHETIYAANHAHTKGAFHGAAQKGGLQRRVVTEQRHAADEQIAELLAREPSL